MHVAVNSSNGVLSLTHQAAGEIQTWLLAPAAPPWFPPDEPKAREGKRRGFWLVGRPDRARFLADRQRAALSVHIFGAAAWEVPVAGLPATRRG
jgi:hypothetical protein